MILKVLVCLLKNCELALEHGHLAENILKGWWLLGHGFSLIGTIVGTLAVCHGWNLDKYLRKIARTWGIAIATNLAWRYPGLSISRYVGLDWLKNGSSFDSRHQEHGYSTGCFCAAEACYILECKASTDAVGRASPNANASWAFIES